MCEWVILFLKNLAGNGKLFDIFLVDKKGAGIRAVIFNDGVDMFESSIKSGAIYQFSYGRIKHVSAPFVLENTPFEFSFNSQSKICELDKDEYGVFPDNTHYVSIKDIVSFSSGKQINLIGIISEFSAAKTITTGAGKKITKRDFFLVDDSSKKVLCTAWGQFAEEDFEKYKNQVIMILGGKINVYRGRKTISVGIGTSLFHDVCSANAAKLSNWFENIKSHDFDEIECEISMIGKVSIEAFRSDVQ